MSTSLRMRLLDAARESTHSDAAPCRTDDAEPLGGSDALVLERVIHLLPRHEGALPLNVRLLRVVWEEEDYPGDQKVQASLSRLIANGSLLPCLVAGEAHVTTQAYAQVKARQLFGPDALRNEPALAAATRRSLAPKASLAPPPAPEALNEGELFELQVALDVERERALMYRVFVVLEVLALLLLGREFMLRFLGLS